MSDGWDIVNEYADTVAAMVEEENKLRALLAQIHQDAKGAWGTTGASETLKRIAEQTAKYLPPNRER